MRKTIWWSLILLVFDLFPAVHAETWHWVSPLPTGNNITDVAWIGDRAWVVDDAGVVLRSTDNGSSWIWQDTPIRVPRARMTFVDSLYGWVVGGVANSGEEALIIHTSDGGINWVDQTPRMGRFNFQVDFVNRDMGWVLNQVDYYDGPSRILATTDGGSRW